MPLPIANFTLSFMGLSVTFTDSSLNVPTSWAWTFGDAGTSILQNPSHTYATPGTYTIKLVATNGSGASSKTLLLDVTTEGVILTIPEMVLIKLPGALAVDPNTLNNYITIEQDFIAPLLNTPLDAIDFYKENKWPLLGNVLVAELVAYKITTDQINQLILALAQTSSSASTTTAQAGIKRIVTGPSEAEWFNNAELVAAFLKTSFAGGSIFSTLALASICSLAARLRISHPLCKRVIKLTTLPQIIR